MMAGIAIAASEPIPAAGSSTGAASDNPAGAALFGDALGTAVARSGPPASDPAGDQAPTGEAAAPSSTMLGAATALAAMLGRIAGGTPTASAPPAATAPAPATTPAALPPAVTAQAPVTSASDGATAPSADAAAVLEPGPAKRGARSAAADDDPTDPDATTTTAPPAPADGSAVPPTTVPPTAVPVVPVVPEQRAVETAPPAPGPTRDGRVGATSRAAASPDARTSAADRSTDPGRGVEAPAGSPDASSVAAAVAPTPAAAPAPAGSTDPSAAMLAAPVQQTAPTTGPAPQPAAPSLVATTDPTVAQQLQGPLVALRSAPDGDHVMVVRVSPEHLGSVTVHATVSHGDLSVQLIASNADGHDALRSMLTDLRRDLGAGATGTATTLSLATGDAPQQDQRGQQTTWIGAGAGGASSGGGSSAREERLPWAPATRAADDITTDRRLPASSSALLDVLA